MYLVEARIEGEGRAFAIDDGATSRTYRLPAAGQQDYLDFYARAADDLGTRRPHNRQTRTLPPPAIRHRPLLTAPLSSDILYGYGDPAVLWVEEERAWYMVATSNDAPDAFPILRTRDLAQWEQVGFVFPRGAKPAWTADGAIVSDYWAPELHRVGDAYLICFSAREAGRSLSIGIARSDRAGGPFVAAPEPLLRGGVIDAHVFVGNDGPILFWKRDSNGVWPRRIARMVADDPWLADALFVGDADRRTAALAGAMWRWAAGMPVMEQFFLLQPLIEAAVADFAGLRARLKSLGGADAREALKAMRTPIFAQRMTPDGSALTGEQRVVLVNDRDWEGHLIEGPWLTRADGRYYLFYAGNDFSTDEYGVGVAVADDPFGPYVKTDAPLLRSDAEWTGPGHPSVAPGPDGTPMLFYHAFVPGRAGYKEFRAVLGAGLRFRPDGVDLVP